MPCAKKYQSLPTWGEGIFKGPMILNLKVQRVAYLTVGRYRGLWPQAMVSFLEEQPQDFPTKGGEGADNPIPFSSFSGTEAGPCGNIQSQLLYSSFEGMSPRLTYQDICSKRTINQDFIQRDLKDLEHSHGSSALMPVFWGRVHMFLKHLC